uniref:Uncharacterized protein n=1 Tax=Setaria viridis TaxID=4556 RepID=A0A4U6VYI9_SETVI|nr:hypothetical protein SEVIR_2G317500v2 [Setaria viridis]
MRSSSSSSSTTSRLLLVVGAAAASGVCCLALVLAVGGACTDGGVAVHGGRPRPPSLSLVDYSLAAAARVNDYPAGVGGGGGRDLAGGAAAAAEQDYGFVDPTPDTRRRGGTAPIPHN